MRRFILVVALLAVPAWSVAPGLVGGSTSHTAAQLSHPSAAGKCKKAKTRRQGHRPKCVHNRHLPKSGLVAPTQTNTPVPSDTLTPVPVATSTNTPGPTSTVTLTPTPVPSVSSLVVHANIADGYQAGFFVCGLPSGVTATFIPNPAVANSETGTAGARATMTISTPRGTTIGAYSLAIHAFYTDPSGKYVVGPPGGGAIDPPAATLTVDAAGNTTLTPLFINPGVGAQNCSVPPPGFAPTPTPTIAPSEVVVSASVSDPHPVVGERETVTASIRARGHGIPDVLVEVRWYFPDAVRSCNLNTGADGTASCSLTIPFEAYHGAVQVQVTFTYNGHQYITYTSFTL